MMSRIGFHGPTAALAAALAALATNGCVTTDPGSDSCSEGKCDEADLPDSAIADSPCDGLITDRSGRGHHKVAGRLHDRLATLAFQAGDDCPTTLDDMIAKIARTDPACAGDKLSTSTRAVSETAKLLGRPTDYRLVTTESCGFDQSQIFFSTFGVPAVTPELPNDQEIIAFDETSGVFNYYTSDGKSLQFFGNSTDLLKGSDGEDRRCANCHVGGGLVMKELESPWLHWNISNDLPGADDLIKAHPILGSSFSATSLENEVKASAETVNKLAVKLRKASGDVRGLLRPLFCSPELNITAQHVTAPEVPEALVLDNRFSGGLSFPYDAVAYQAQLVANNQLVDGGEGRRDTVLAFAIANRAATDANYVSQLLKAKIVDTELINDITLVDFSRPLFSEDRCALLDLLPATSTKLAAADIRAALTAAVANAPAGSAAADLARNLAETGGHDVVAKAFNTACKKRPRAAFTTDAMAIASLNRDLARERPIMEFAATLPDDDLTVDHGARLHPGTCELVTKFAPRP